jgi:hypothetical protein
VVSHINGERGLEGHTEPLRGILGDRGREGGGIHKYSYKPGIDFERKCLDIYIDCLTGLGKEVEDLTGTADDFNHRGDLKVDGYYIQCKFRSQKYYNYFLKDGRIWCSIEDKRVEQQGRDGTSLLKDKSDFIDTVYVVDNKVVTVVRLSTKLFQPWLELNKNRYTIKTAGRGSGTKGTLIAVKDIPNSIGRVINMALC